jgi:hypothetical protein
MAVPPATPTAESRRVYPSDRARADRRRRQKLAARDPQKQRYLDIAQRLQFIADELKDPKDADLRSQVHWLVNQTRLRGCPPGKQDYEQVLDAITNHQCNCVYDIHEETKLPEDVIWKILDGLLTTRAVRQTNEEPRDHIDTKFYATGLPSPSMMVLP